MVRKAYLTPPDIPEGLTCRTLKMPASKEWLGIFNSALLTTVQTWQWEQVNPTDLTIDEAVAQCQVILDQFWATSECDVCRQPNGLKFVRLGEGGHFEELGEDGWQPPTGDYTVPPVPEREGGTEYDQICLAATNAANVLKELYEELADAWGSGLSTAEAIEQFILAVALLILAPISLAVAAIIAIAALIFQVLYETLEFIGADVWTGDFNDRLICVLLNCASNDAGVVTFDYQCVLDGLAAETPIDPPLFYDLRLFGQIAYMLYFIGADGLNLAGATTAITEAICDCEQEWCHEFTGEDYLTVWSATGNGTHSAQGYTNTAPLHITHIEFDYVITGAGSGGDSAAAIFSQNNFTDRIALVAPLAASGTVEWDGNLTGSTGVAIFCNDNAAPGASISITRVLERGIGAPPYAINCE